jgi:hypothetical protein
MSGNCENVELTFVNSTGMAINIPERGHTVENPGSFAEGEKDLVLGSSLQLVSGGRATSTEDLTVRCADDLRIFIVYSGTADRDFNQLFTNVNVEDKRATLTLTNN